MLANTTPAAQVGAPFCYTMHHEPNDPSRRGQLAGQPVRFGAFRRFRIEPVHTRFDSVSWFGYDAERSEEDGSPLCVCIALSLAEAQETFKALKAKAPWMFSERLSAGEDD